MREIRLRLGLTQADVTRAVGVARSVISRLEAGDPAVSLTIRCRVAVLLGGRLRLPVYPDGTPMLHDTAHARIAERLVEQTHVRWRPALETRVPGPGHRSTDVRLDDGSDIVLVEVETHVRRWEEILRELHDKRAAVIDAAAGRQRVHVMLVLPPTRHHRELILSLPSSVGAAFPASSSDILAALRGSDSAWPGDGILWIAGGSRPPRRPELRPESPDDPARVSRRSRPGDPARVWRSRLGDPARVCRKGQHRDSRNLTAP